MNLGRKIFLKYEFGTFLMCIVPALIYMVSVGVFAGIKLFLLCFLIAQPFLLYAFKEEILGKKSKEGIKGDEGK